jgi:hypothetical protein
MEENGNLEDISKNLLNYADVDKTTSQFLDYFYNDFLSYFPNQILADKRKVLKIARQLYEAKGTKDSFRFLFRVLYNSDVEFFYTKDAVLRASAGKWYVAKSLKLDSDNVDFLNCINYRIFGETSKSIATIENAIIAGSKIEVFISDIQRLFLSGETVRVVDSNNQDVLMEDGMPLTAKIVGQISQIRINPNYRGLLYRPGDPVIVYGGLTSANGIGATAVVGETTSGSIQRVNVIDGGYGYRYSPNTIISLSDAPGAVVVVQSLNPDPALSANVTFIPIDNIGLKKLIQIGAADYNFSNIALANASTSLANAFSYVSISTDPISAVIVKNSGGGIVSQPSIRAISQYDSDTDSPGDLRNLGILAPIKIVSGGQGYQNNDIILFSDGYGAGANAKVTEVDANGTILSVGYTYSTSDLTYPLGGLGYRIDGLPTVTVSSANVGATNAILTVPGILGDGATFSTTVDRVGAISSIKILNPGEDYIAAPNVSLKVQDMVVANLQIGLTPVRGDVIYQGNSTEDFTYKSKVDSIVPLVLNADPTKTLYRLRSYDYTSIPNFSLPIKVANTNIVMNLSSDYVLANAATRFDSTGVITYGDGTALANASFLNGLVISEGQYLDTSGQPSSFDVLQDENYNNFTYQITVEKEIAKYRDTLLNLLHPTGMKVIGRYDMRANCKYDLAEESVLQLGHTLGFYTGDPGSYVTMSSTWENQSNNIVNFYGLVGANIQDFIFSTNTVLSLTLSNGFGVQSEVTNVYADGANTVILKDNVWLTYANVAHVTANAGSNVINISSFTDSYDIINNGYYSDPEHPLGDIVFAGDKILVANNTEKTVQSVDSQNNTITLTTSLANVVNSLISVQRTVLTSDVLIFGSVGQQYYPELLTQDGKILLTQDNKVITLG